MSQNMNNHLGYQLRQDMKTRDIIPFMGVYDVFSASIAGKYYDSIFISGFSFAASYYGLPDIGFIAWSDIVAFVQRVKTVLPQHYLLVDIDDGYVDTEVACHVVSLLESIGASGVIIEDQKRPRRCGHFEGKLLMELPDFLQKLKRVLATRQDLVVVARTDATDMDDILRRTTAYAEAGADAILADGITSLEVIKTLKCHLDKPIVFNQIAGGKSPICSLTELKEAGVSLVNYSTPCLFAAQTALEETMKRLREQDGFLLKNKIGVGECTALLNQNLVSNDK
ncbi:MAG: isocitrate lyase/PEP mutase family protein [Coleofasciculus sp. A1-SPW-01]|uniref:isocitrate lyase/PEP mutase family protein n=1 Tax=Coleofasciculus sp. A1-SPW-01 TaxID=3070819 RepID=UPI00330242C7